ncbi:MAG TPA: glycosyltransferase family 39 protein [Methylomirabilota bacterium]
MSGPARSLKGLVSTYPAWSIFVVAFVLRAALVLSVGHLVPESSDKLQRYDQIAFALMRGEGFSLDGAPTAISGPVYPLLAAGIYALFGYSAAVVRVVFSALDAAHCAIFYLVVQRTFGGAVPVLTALALILNPLTIYCVTIMSPEIVFLPFHAAFLLYLVSALQSGGYHASFLSGMALGVATLARAVPILLPLAALPVYLLNTPRVRKGLIHFAILLLGFTLLIGPWIVRNYVAFHRFIPVQTLGGVHLYLATPARQSAAAERQERDELRRLNHLERDKALYVRAWQRITERPDEFVQLMGQRLRQMWYRTDSRRFEGLLGYASSVLLLLAAAGMVLSRRRWRELSLFYLVIAYYVMLHTILIAILRYTLPIIPLILMFAMVPISLLMSRAVDGTRVKRRAA